METDHILFYAIYEIYKNEVDFDTNNTPTPMDNEAATALLLVLVLKAIHTYALVCTCKMSTTWYYDRWRQNYKHFKPRAISTAVTKKDGSQRFHVIDP